MMVTMNPFRKKKRTALIHLDDVGDTKAEILDVPFLLEAGEVDRSRLCEVSDPALKECLLSLAPKAAKKATQTPLYKVVLPKGAALVPSKAFKGGLRAFFMGEKGIEGHATLVRADSLLGPAAAAYAVASVIVGQHYMTEISRRIDRLYDGIADVHLFQKGELQSKAKALALSLCHTASHQQELLKNKELRQRELVNLDAQQREAEQLLSQCTGALEALSRREEKDYAHYAHDVEEADGYLQCQSVLAEALGHIVELKYVLNLGKVSLDYCKGPYDRYMEEALHSRQSIADFHHHHIESLHIEPEKMRHQKDGLIYKALRILPKFRSSKHNFAPVEEELAGTINIHLGEELYVLDSPGEFEEKEVVLYVEGDKVYQENPEKK